MNNITLQKPIAFFDLETTGTNIVKDRIVEISIVKINQKKERTNYSKRVNPTIPISKESSRVHGIYDYDVKSSPEFKVIAKEIYRFLEGCDIGGFNVLKFDIPLLTEEFLRCGIDFKIDNRKIIDAQKIFHLMEKRTLGAAYEFYCGKELKDAHSSMADTLATIEVLDSQIDRYQGKDVRDISGRKITTIDNSLDSLHKISTSNMIDFAKRMVYDNEGNPIFNFGKHKGKSVSYVLQKEPAYYDWILNNDFPQDTKRKLTQIKLSLI